jgi:predicted RecB family nuclease
MIDIPTIDELRDTRRRLAEQSGLDVRRYAATLQQAAPRKAGPYVSTPLLPEPMSPSDQSTDLEPERARA